MCIYVCRHYSQCLNGPGWVIMCTQCVSWDGVLHHLNIHCLFKLFSSGQRITMTNSRKSQAHILLFSGDLPALCVVATVFAALLPCPSPQTLLHLSCWPRRRAELNQSNLQNGKRAHRHACSPLPPLLLRCNWHLVKEKLWLGAERENRGTQESHLHSECKAFCRDFALVLQASSSQWVLHWQMAASLPLIMPHCAAMAGFESPTITTVAKWLEICRVLKNSSGPFSSSLFFFWANIYICPELLRIIYAIPKAPNHFKRRCSQPAFYVTQAFVCTAHD